MKILGTVNYEKIGSNPKIKDYILDKINSGYDISHVINRINDANDKKKSEMINKVIEMMKEDYGYPPSEFCWLSMGSSGRKEQIFRTDQDNAIIYNHAGDFKFAAKIYRYFEKLSYLVNAEFVKIGFELCPGNVMASNEFWRGDIDFWLKRIESWIDYPDGKNIRNLTIFLDFRCIYGKKEYSELLKEKLKYKINENPMFLKFLAEDACSGSLPIGFLNRIVTLKNSEHKDEINIKTQMRVYMVDCIRVLALRNGCFESNSLERIDFLEDNKVLSPELAEGLREGFNIIYNLSLNSENNYINIKQIEEDEKQKILETLRNISLLINVTREVFFTY